MKQTLQIITALLFITSTAFPQSKANVNSLKEYGGKTFKVDDDKPYTGRVFDVYESTGGIKLEGYYRNGIKNGKWASWYENGQKEVERTYKNGKEDGLFTGWYENGQKEVERTYKNGESDGLQIRWHKNGQKSSERTYKDGYFDGLFTGWFKNGQKWGEGTYKDGEYFISNTWDKNGEIMVKDRNGLNTFWDENGQKMMEGNYKDGKLDRYTEWYKNGQKWVEETYKDGEKDGKWTSWYKGGQKEEEKNYKDGEKDGKWTWWTENGQKDKEVTYKDGGRVITCDNIAGYYSGSQKVGYASGTASLNISNNCRFSFTSAIPGHSKTTQYGQIQKSGSSYRFNWDDGSTYTVSVDGNSIVISGYNWSADLRK